LLEVPAIRKQTLTTKVSKLKTVLYADDDLDDKEWVRDACKDMNASLDMRFVSSGKDVLTYLSGAAPEEYPSLIVLDLNMPELDGRQTLKKLKADPVYQQIPVIIVSTSSNVVDKEVCRRLGASLYLTKPDSHKEWREIVQILNQNV
jgi:CheY-like chemotaxis protein